MHCVYTAFEKNMIHIGEPVYAKVFEAYRHHKALSHDRYEDYTFTGVVPWLYWQMLHEHNLHSPNVVEMHIERSYITPPEYMQEANQVQRQIMAEKTRFWGIHVEPIELEPAIYCLLNEFHAEFMLEKPTWPGARILFAVQIFVAHPKPRYKEENDE